MFLKATKLNTLRTASNVALNAKNNYRYCAKTVKSLKKVKLIDLRKFC